MSMRLVQLRDADGTRAVAALEGEGPAHRLTGIESTYALARQAIAEGISLEDAARARLGAEIDLSAAEAEGRLLAPIDHPDPAHLYLTGTGLTHLGSAEGRDKMHKAAAGG